MEWRCVTCEHLNGSNLTDCEVCGTLRNLYAEEAFEHKKAIKSLETQVRTLKGSLTKARNERDHLRTQIAEKSDEVDNLAHVNELKDHQCEVLKSRETTLLKNNKLKDEEIYELNKKIVFLTKAIVERDERINESVSKIKTQEADIENFRNEIIIVSKRSDTKTSNYILISLLCMISIGMGTYIYYTQVYTSNLKADYIAQTNRAFSNFSDYALHYECRKEDIGARTTLAGDLSNDGKLDGIVIATFNGAGCRNSFQTVLYVYDLKRGFVNPPLSFPLSKLNEFYMCLRGIENGKLVFDKWNVKDYDQKKYDSERVKNSHTRIYISVKNDSLISTAL